MTASMWGEVYLLLLSLGKTPEDATHSIKEKVRLSKTYFPNLRQFPAEVRTLLIISFVELGVSGTIQTFPYVHSWSIQGRWDLIRENLLNYEWNPKIRNFLGGRNV